MLIEDVNSGACCANTSRAYSLRPMGYKKAKLQDWQKADAERLKAIYTAKSTTSQERFGAEYGIGSQPMVWQYLEGYRPLNLKAAIRFATGLEVSVADFSPTLADMLAGLPAAGTAIPEDPFLRQLIDFYLKLSEDGRDELVGAANRIYSKQHPQDAKAAPFPDAPIPEKKKPKPVTV